MTHEKWIEHIDGLLASTGIKRPSQGGVRDMWNGWITAHKPGCKICAERNRTRKASEYAKFKRQIYADLGMKRVTGALGGVYYE